MNEDKTVKEVADSFGQLVGEEPLRSFLIVEFPSVVATVGTVDEDQSAPVEAAKAIAGSLHEGDLMSIRNEIDALLEETNANV